MSGFRHSIDWDAMEEENKETRPSSKATTSSNRSKGNTNPSGMANPIASQSSSNEGGARGGNGPDIELTDAGYPKDEANSEYNQEASAIEIPAGQTLKGRIEAVLFLTGKALSLHEIAELIAAPHEDVEIALVELMGDYNFREESSLEIDDTDGYILQVKEEYSDIVNRMMPLEMTAAELRTLSAIAIKAPVLQSDLIEWRGATAYDHIANLLKRRLISKRREGRSYILNVTRNFHEYFKLTADKKDLANLVQLIGKEENEEKGSNLPPGDEQATLADGLDIAD